MSEEHKEFKNFSSFTDLDDVCDIFGYEYQYEPFVEEKKYIMNDYFKQSLLEDFGDLRNFVNEFVICETLIRPILSDIARVNKLPLWSHVKLEYDKNIGLTGEPDYFLAQSTMKKGKRFSNVVVCLGEAKKGKIDDAWGQVGAAMVAAHKLNGRENENVLIYGLVSTGKSWEFGKLENKLFSIDPNSQATPADLQKVLNIINWMFCEARKNADILAKFAKNNKKRS